MRQVVTIDRLGARGEGIADVDTGPLQVAYALPGETVAVETAGDRGFLLEVMAASPERAVAPCPHFSACGGCATQHMAQALYARWKTGLVENAMRRAGLDAPVLPLVDARGAGRRRVTLHVRYAGVGRATRAEAGFMRVRSHDLIDLDRCPVLVPALARAPDVARALGELLKARRKPLDVQVTATDGGLDVDIRGAGAPTPADQLALSEAAAALDLGRLTIHGERVLERRAPFLPMGRARVVQPPGGFLQATAAGEAALAGLVLAGLSGARRVGDLFCGVGPFALRLAETATVAAFDSSSGAISALNRAVATTQGLKPASASVRDLFRRPLQARELAGLDGLVFDPPRAGAQAQAAEIARSSVRRVVAVSCDVQSFVRDARTLVEGGYALRTLTPVDQFVHSPHVEIVALFERSPAAS